MLDQWTSRRSSDLASLGSGELHLWLVELDSLSKWGERPVDQLLSPDERERARRFRSAVDAQRWTRSRAALRTILGLYVGFDPSQIGFIREANGKPALSTPSTSLVRFNIAHSGSVALIGVSAGYEIGVDVERLRLGLDEVALSQRVLGESVTRVLESLDPPSRTTAFFRFWVRHEAAAKFLGLGLEDEASPGARVGILVRDVNVGHDYAAAVATGRSTDGERARNPLSIRHMLWEFPLNRGVP